MNYNPYAPPQAQSPSPAPGPIFGGAPQPWNASQVLSIAWSRFKDVWPVVIGAYVVQTVIVGLIGQIPSLIQLAKPDPWVLIVAFVVTLVANQLLAAFLQVGFTRILLEASRGGKPVFATLFSGADRYLPALGCTLLLGLTVLVGTLCLIVPGIILGLGLGFGVYYVVDANMGPVQALQASWEATRGKKGEIFVLGLLGLLVNLAGLAACCVGLLASVPLYMLAFTVAFTRASGRAPMAAPGEPGFDSPALGS